MRSPPMHQTGSRHLRERGIETEQRVQQRAAGIAGARMHDQPCRLVDDDEVGVLVDHLDGNRLGRELEHGLEAGIDRNRLAPAKFLSRRHDRAVEREFARFDPLANPAAGVVGPDRSHGPIQALAGELGRHGRLPRHGIVHYAAVMLDFAAPARAIDTL